MPLTSSRKTCLWWAAWLVVMAPAGPLWAADAAAPARSPGAPAQSQQWRDPREFLLSVMNDPQAPLALRVDAAKALLAAPSPGD